MSGGVEEGNCFGEGDSDGFFGGGEFEGGRGVDFMDEFCEGDVFGAGL